MLSEHRQRYGVMGSGLYLSEDECYGILQVLTMYQEQQSLFMNQGEERVSHSFMLPTTCLVLEGIYFREPNFLSYLLEMTPNLSHISLQVGCVTTLFLNMISFAKQMKIKFLKCSLCLKMFTVEVLSAY